MKDASPRLRVQAMRVSETLYKAGDKSFADDYRAMTKDPDTNVVIQAMLSASYSKLKDLPEIVKTAQASNSAKGIALIGARLTAPAPAALGGRGRGSLTPVEQKRLEQGRDVFDAVCFACHAADGFGAPLAGAPAGTMMAPPLAGSPRVQGHRDYIIKILLKGMTGELDGKTYRDVMVPMDNTDEWVAGIASYVRTSFGNTGDLVTPADVARVRAEIAGRKTPWNIADLEASLPTRLDWQQWKLTASHGAATAPAAATLRGWTSGARQVPGMWFEVALPKAVLVTELQFESANAPNEGRGGRGAAGGAPPPPPVGMYPRAYSVQVSMDGKTWSKPVAQGQGTGARTTITFAPARAQFVRITLTDNIADAPQWSIRNLRIFEARGTR
jgi:mono/diheme cytochrome c family protein